MLQVPSQLGTEAQSPIEVKPGPQPRGLGSKADSVGGDPGLSPHPESDAPRSPTLQVEAVWPIPVSIDNVQTAVTVEVSQRHATTVLVGVIQPWGATRGWGETGPPPCLHLPRVCAVVLRWVHPTQGCIPALTDALVHLNHPWWSGGLWVTLAVPPSCTQPFQADRTRHAWGSLTAGCSPYSPTAAATSRYVPSPWLWKRKLGLFSLPQNMSEALSLRMGPTATPRPPGGSSTGVRGQLAPCLRGVCTPHIPLSAAPLVLPGTQTSPFSLVQTLSSGAN